MNIENSGAFYDYSGQITKVNGAGAMEMVYTPPTELSYSTGERCALTVIVDVPAGASSSVQFQWQKKDNNTWINLPKLLSTMDMEETENDRCEDEYTVSEGTYRCLVTRTSENEVITTLSVLTTVTLSDPEPAPTPIPTYRVTLPSVESATIMTTDSELVTEGESFTFQIQIAEGYTADNLQVKANGTELLPDANGRYTIASITDNVVVTITGIVKANPDVIEGVTKEATLVWATKGQIHIHLTKEATVMVTDFAGRVVRQFVGNVGDAVIPIVPGQYMVTIAGEIVKVIP